MSLGNQSPAERTVGMILDVTLKPNVLHSPILASRLLSLVRKPIWTVALNTYNNQKLRNKTFRMKIHWNLNIEPSEIIGQEVIGFLN